MRNDRFQSRERGNVAYYHLPGLFEFYELYRLFLSLFYTHREYFYDWCEIGSIYGAPEDCLWGGGRVEAGEAEPEEVLALMQKYYLVSSTTKVLTEFQECLREIQREDFQYVVPDFRLNKMLDKWNTLSEGQKDKVEFLCNECCWFGCRDRKACYEDVSRKNLGKDGEEHRCTAPNAKEGYRFSKAMTNPGFISVDDIKNIYLPMGFTNFKIEGRGLGSALILEFLLYYMTKPEYQLHVREELYLDNMLDLF